MAGAALAASSARLARREPEGEDDGEGETETEPGLDKGNVASGRDRDASARRARIASARDAWSRLRSFVAWARGVTVKAQDSTVMRLTDFDPRLTD